MASTRSLLSVAGTLLAGRQQVTEREGVGQPEAMVAEQVGYLYTSHSLCRRGRA
ncbi:hypothetical protein ACSZM7_16105 [Aeromonas veronii]|uniref:hypothetical protein n=1 Tax=Aeromonas caviae TaxID=648 RepID=UPI00191D6A8A|nr:hypothetical protein [Aeromonas caviae]MBL0645836.1 hypothetical protein [Aeromonas caviae]